METKTMKAVFTVVERNPGKSFWTRVGVGFVNQDGSITLRLDAVPVNGVLQVRDWEAFDRRGPETSNGGGPGGEAPRTWRRENGPPGPARDPGGDAGRAHFPGDALV
jgi:hypothetical protein